MENLLYYVNMLYAKFLGYLSYQQIDSKKNKLRAFNNNNRFQTLITGLTFPKVIYSKIIS